MLPLGAGKAELLVGGVEDSDGDGLGEGDGDGEVGVGAGGLLRDGLVRPGVGELVRERSGEACGDALADADGGASEVLVEFSARPTPASEESPVAPAGASPPSAVYGASALAPDGPSSALMIAYTLPTPPAATAVSRPAAITNRRVGLPRRDLSSPRS